MPLKMPKGSAIVRKENPPDGYTCKCGTTHKYPAYVYAHWRDKINHTCECGRVNVIVCGVVCKTIKTKKGD